VRTPLFAALTLVAWPAAPQAQVADWLLLASSPTASFRFEDGSFLTPSLGWIVDGQGRMFRTEDAGDTWDLRSDIPDYLRTVVFTSPSRGFAGTLYSDRRLYMTDDAGATMVDVTGRISPPIGGGVCGLYAIDSNTILGVGQYSGPAYLIRTVDGGETWQSTDMSALAGSLVDIKFLDATRGFAIGGTNGQNPGGRVVVLATENGGQTWAQRFVGSAPAPGASEWGWKISFPTPLVGYVSVEQTFGGPGKILKTTDGGLTWSEIILAQPNNMQAIGFLTAERGWLGGHGFSYATLDGGLTWNWSTSFDGDVNRFEFFGDTLGYAFGERVYSIDARPVTPAPGGPSGGSTLGIVRPNPADATAHFTFDLAASGRVSLAIFDSLGRRVATLVDGVRPAGSHELDWSRRLDDGRPAPPGVYAARLTAAGEVTSRMFALTR
jgi:photosystem II stability/assembly factor-like uncharacterized protein